MLGSYVFCNIFCLGSYGFLSFYNGFLSGYFGFRGFVSLFAVGSSWVPAGFRGFVPLFAVGSGWVPVGFRSFVSLFAVDVLTGAFSYHDACFNGSHECIFLA